MFRKIALPLRLFRAKSLLLAAAFVLSFHPAEFTLADDSTPPAPAQMGSETSVSSLSAETEAEASAGTVASRSLPAQLDTPAAPANPQAALIVGQSRPLKVDGPDLAKMPGRLAIAGILIMPLDFSLEKSLSGAHSIERPDGLTEAVSSLGSPTVLLPALGGMYFFGSRDDKDTAKLALAALANASLLTQGIKRVSGRVRPDITSEEGEFQGPTSRIGYDSFPSGHTAAAFAVATVLANRHPKQKWLYYSLATVVGLARLRKSAHFPSDVLVGAGIGIYAGNDALRHGPRVLSIKF